MVVFVRDQNAAGAVQDKASDVAGATQQKSSVAGNYAGEKWEQTKQATSDTAQAAKDKAGQAKEGTGNVLQQVLLSITGTFSKRNLSKSAVATSVCFVHLFAIFAFCISVGIMHIAVM